MLVSRAEISWMLHIDGLGGIWQSRGPWLLKSYSGRSIFLEHRITLVERSYMKKLFNSYLIEYRSRRQSCLVSIHFSTNPSGKKYLGKTILERNYPWTIWST